MTDIISEKACEMLANGTEFVIASIISHEGSTPRISGTKMIIFGDGSIYGTIGGGLLEARVMEKAGDIIEEKSGSTFMPFDLSDDDVASMDMICGGRADIFLDLVFPTVENMDVFNKWNRMLENRESGFLITAVSGDRSHIAGVFHGIIDQDHVLHGALPFSPHEIENMLNKTGVPAALSVIELDKGLVFMEAAIKPRTVFLFGAGHVAKPTAHLCALTGFYVTVLDDREEFANAANFPDSHEIHVIDSFETACSGLHIDEDSFLVIFTRGHLHDRIVLAQALKTRAAYIGMIGSRKKRDNIYKALLNTGYDQTDIDRVHSPIGLAIGAQSPEEIAVSIVAEMIGERARASK